jgi:hypothetical protein
VGAALWRVTALLSLHLFGITTLLGTEITAIIASLWPSPERAPDHSRGSSSCHRFPFYTSSQGRNTRANLEVE